MLSCQRAAGLRSGAATAENEALSAVKILNYSDDCEDHSYTRTSQATSAAAATKFSNENAATAEQKLRLSGGQINFWKRDREPSPVTPCVRPFTK